MFKKVWNVVLTILVIITILMAIAFAGVKLVGLAPYAVLSGSMEPTYHTGSLVYVKKVDYKTLEVGDPITFEMDDHTIATHRIVEIIPDEADPDILRFATKGDANDFTDGGKVHCNNIIGKPVFTIPYLGFAAQFIQHPPGMYIAIVIAAIIIMLSFVPDLFDDKDDNDDDDKSTTSESS